MPDVNWLAVLAAALSAFLLGGLWYSPAMFQLDDIQEPYLTPDGLAVIFVGVKQGARDVYILVRDQFRAFTLADLKTLYHPTTALDLHTPFVNADCSRLYFSTAVGIQYVTP